VVVCERLFAHLNEVFFGDIRALASILHASGAGDRPYSTEDAMFGGTPVLRLRGPDRVDITNVYRVLRQLAAE
jgi:5-methylcytosine-specific restriction protein B